MVKFLEHFALISDAIREKGLWDEEDGFYYDQLRQPDGTVVPVRVRSMVGILPLTAFAVIDETRAPAAPRRSGKRFSRMIGDRHLDLDRHAAEGHLVGEPGNRRLLLGVVEVEHLLRIFTRLFDEEAFLSPYGLRAVSRWHLEHPYHLDVDGMDATIDYEPAESTTGDVRRQLELARADLVPRQLPRRQLPAPLRPLLRRRRQARIPDRFGAGTDTSARSARTSAAA